MENNRPINQYQLEVDYYAGGIDRAAETIDKLNKIGMATSNSFADPIISTFYHPLVKILTDELKDDVNPTHTRMAHFKSLKDLPIGTVALVTLRTALNTLLSGKVDVVTLAKLAHKIGMTVYQETCVKHIYDEEPELYNYLLKELMERRTEDSNQRFTMLTGRVKEIGMAFPRWERHTLVQVGVYLIGLLETILFVELTDYKPEGGRQMKPTKAVFLSNMVVDIIVKVNDKTMFSRPLTGPCIEPPKDWSTPYNGGFHTVDMRRRANMIHTKATIDKDGVYSQKSMPAVYECINALQKTTWRVNKRILGVMLDLIDGKSWGKFYTPNYMAERPTFPPHLEGRSKASFTPSELAEFKKFSAAMSTWRHEAKAHMSGVLSTANSIKMAKDFVDYEELYFVYFMDTRGRFYPVTTGINPQGNDIAKSLLEFKDGDLIGNNPDTIMHFLCIGANKFGYDKDTLKGRMNWVLQHKDVILSIADDPLGVDFWRSADKPFQFLAFCFEFKEWINNPKTFRSHLAASQDGSCNGLQHLSAMMRDEVGASATNIVPNAKMQDIYAIVADKAYSLMLSNDPPQPNPQRELYRQDWIKHGMNRKVAKRPTMTTPYGVTKHTCESNLVRDYVQPYMTYQAKEMIHVSKTAMDYVWPAIGGVVIKGREAMDWLSKTATQIIQRDRTGVITWRTPSGFTAIQRYNKIKLKQVRSYLHGVYGVVVYDVLPDANIHNHANGMAPNFVHSMDAAHLTLTVAKCVQYGVKNFAMIHDDYGVPPSQAKLLGKVIRETFYTMYRDNDVIQQLYDKYPYVTPPSKGDLDLECVLHSEFFYS